MTSNRQRKKMQRAMTQARQPTRPQDPFGLNREATVVSSNVRNVFTPHQPVSESNFLFGRQEEVGNFITALNTPGRHALLFGERGVGKTSLANVVRLLYQATKGKPYFIKRCDKRDTFTTIVRDALIAIDRSPHITQFEATQTRSRGARADASVLSFSTESSNGLSTTFDMADFYSPSTVAAELSNLDALLVIDEADALGDPGDRMQLAELIKLLSDSQSPFKIMIVGIADTANELTAAHPSVRRCLSEKKLGRMSSAELREIMTAGGRVLGIQFDSEVLDGIVHMSLGYPHFTHLLALKSAELAIGDRRKVVTRDDLRRAIASAVQDSEGSLTSVYTESIRSTSTTMFQTVVVAAAKIGKVEFSAPELRAQISSEIEQEVTQNSLNNYFQRLVSTDGSTILRRTAHGHYRFEDPRMASYVRMANGILG